MNSTRAKLVLAKTTSSIYHLSIGIFGYFFNVAIVLNYNFCNKHNIIDDDRNTIGIGH